MTIELNKMEKSLNDLRKEKINADKSDLFCIDWKTNRVIVSEDNGQTWKSKFSFDDRYGLICFLQDYLESIISIEDYMPVNTPENIIMTEW